MINKKNLNAAFLILCLFRLPVNAQSFKGMSIGMDDEVNAVKEYNGKIYAGGRFSTSDNLSTKGFAVWDSVSFDPGYKWHHLADFSSWVYDMEIYNGDLFVAGEFVLVNSSIPSFHITKYNGGWTAVGNNGTSGAVYALKEYNGELYAGGTFTSATGIAAKNIAKWNGSAWSPVGGGIKAQQYDGVRHMAVYNNELYVSGSFSIAGTTPATNIAKWDGNNWYNVANLGNAPLGKATINTMVDYQGTLFAGGTFSTINGSPVNRLAAFNGSTWADAGGGLTNILNITTLGIHNNDLYVTGTFNVAGSPGTNNIAKWNGTSWDAFAEFAGQVCSVNVLATGNGSMIAGGYFSSITGNSCKNIASYKEPGISTVGIKEYKTGSAASIFPNPFSDQAIVRSADDLKGSTQIIYTASGEEVRRFKHPGGKEFILQRNGLPAGIYFLSLRQNNKSISWMKFLIVDE